MLYRLSRSGYFSMTAAAQATCRSAANAAVKRHLPQGTPTLVVPSCGFDLVFSRCYRQTDTPDAPQVAVRSGRAAGAPDRRLAAPAGPWIRHPAGRSGVPSAPPIAPRRDAQPRTGVPGKIGEGTPPDFARSLRLVGTFAGRSLPLSQIHEGKRLAGCG